MDIAVILTDCPSLMVVNFRDGDILTEIPLDRNRKYSHMLHPPTYENKVLVTNDLGEIDLFNIKTGKVVFNIFHLALIISLENLLFRRAKRKNNHDSTENTAFTRDWSWRRRWHIRLIEHQEEQNPAKAE